MTTEGVDIRRRRLLTAAATVVGGVGAVYASAPFISSMQPSAKAQAAGAPIQVDIGKLEPGQRIIAKWRGRPVWILRRTQEALDDLASLESVLSDPQSADSEQPDYCRNPHRSIKPEVLIAIGVCTHLGCSPTFFPDRGGQLGPDWKGGFFCPCHGSRFDFAGRVYSGVPAPTNLTIPPHQYLSDTRILIGDDSPTAGGTA